MLIWRFLKFLMLLKTIRWIIRRRKLLIIRLKKYSDRLKEEWIGLLRGIMDEYYMSEEDELAYLEYFAACEEEYYLRVQDE